MKRREFAFAGICASLPSFGIFAAERVGGPVQLVVPFTPAGVTDSLARTVGDALSKLWEQPVIVENRPGASGNIGSDFVARAKADGQTLLLATSALLTINPHLIKGGFDPAEQLTPITTIGTSDVVVVAYPGVPVKNLMELAAYGKEKPDGLSFASPSNASTHHLTGELLQRRLGVKLVHVPYKGSAPGLNDVIAGHVPLMIDNIISALPFIRAGRLRALAVSGAVRSPILPDVPTFQESGLQGLQTSTWFPLLGPKGLAPALTKSIQADVVQVLRQAGIKEKLEAQGIVPSGETSAALGERIARDSSLWKKVIEDAGIKL